MHGLANSNPLLGRIGAWPRWVRHIAALAAGGFAATGFAPTETVAAPIVGLAAFLLLLAARPGGFGAGYFFGLGHFAVGLTWIATAFTYQSAMPPSFGWIAVVGLSGLLALFPAAAAYAARKLGSRIVPLSLTFAGLFMLTEILRGVLLTGFPWNPLGVPWLQIEGVAGLAASIGATGLSGLMLLAAGGLAALLAGRSEPGRWALAAVFPILLAIGAIVPATRQPAPPAKGPTLLLVQPNIGQTEKYASGGFERSIQQLVAMTKKGFAEHPGAVAAVWPEGAVEYPLEEEPELRRQLAAMLPENALLLTGGVAVERAADGTLTGARNSLYALDSSGRILMRYDKSHLVPGGEYLPLRWLAEPLGLARLVPGSLDFLPGPGPQTFRLPGLPPMGPAICYEIIFPAAVVDRNDRPDWIITVSNDAWYGPTGPPQHHAQARLRAIEEGLPVVRVTPTGISSLVGPRGDVIARVEHQTAGLRAVVLPAPLPKTPFARFGLMAPGAFGLVLLALGIMLNRRKT